MKKMILTLGLLNYFFIVSSQDIVKLPYEDSTAVVWLNEEKEYFIGTSKIKVVTNVSFPTIQVFKPTPEKSNGTSVIIAPGGGLYILLIENEGTEVAKWLNAKGITAFVLKYRLVPTGEDGAAELIDLNKNNPAKMVEEVAKVIPLSINDGLNAISYVRKHAREFGIDPNRIGLMGFSAGGAVTMGVAYNYSEENKPDFLVPVYAWTTVMPVQKPKKDSPPMCIICASDDQVGLAPGSIELYNSWYNQHLKVELHMYSKGGHGFGMIKKQLPVDKWIERFYEWSVAEGFTSQKNMQMK